MLNQIINLLAWLLVPVGVLTFVDDLFLRPHRRARALPSAAVDPPWLRAAYAVLPVLAVAGAIKLLRSERLDFSLVLVIVTLVGAAIWALDKWVLRPARDRAASAKGQAPQAIPEPGIVDFITADDRRLAALQDPDNSSFGASFSVPLDAHDNAIAVHRFREIGRCDVDVRSRSVGVWLIGNDKAEPARVGRESADDEVHLVGQSVSIAADLEEFTCSHERFQLSSETCALIARDAQHPHQIPHRGGMMGVLANLG